MDVLQPETLVGNAVAIPEDMTATDGEGREREVHAIINDANVGEPFTLYKSANAWWLDIGKVEKLMFAFKNGMSVEEAIFSVGISRDKYYYFLKIHPEFSHIKDQLSQALGAVAKLTLGTALKKDGSLALRYLQGTQPETFRRVVLPGLPQGTGGYARKTEELFMNEAGEVVVSRKTAILLENYGDNNDTQSESE